MYKKYRIYHQLRSLLSIAAVFLMCVACGDGSSATLMEGLGSHEGALSHDENPSPSAETRDHNINANLELTFELHRQALPAAGNGMLSAFSVRQAFALLYAGSATNTKTDVAEVIGFDEDIDIALEAINAVNDTLESYQLPADQELEAVQLRTANAFFGREGTTFIPDYLDTVSRHLGTGIFSADFVNDPEGSRQTINQWVEDQTETRIKDLLPGGTITSDTLAVLTNAVYFKAPWQSKFEADYTGDGEFTLDDGTDVTVPLMRQTGHFSHLSNEELMGIELPFRGNKLAMTLLSPTSSSLSEFESHLNVEKWQSIIATMQPGNVSIVLPKFEFETGTISLKGALTMLGLGSIFGSADLSAMVPGLSLFISDVLHKTFVKVDEGGTEAAAATAIIVDTESAAEPPSLTISLTQPFVFAIRDIESGQILFFGRVSDPR